MILTMTTLAPLMTSDKADWQTPADLFEQLDAEFEFLVDMAATFNNSMCAEYYGPDRSWPLQRDSLQVPWPEEACWVNPPYGRGIGQWVRKAVEEIRRPGGPSVIVMLVPARTDTQWWQVAQAAAEIRYLVGRLTFQGAPSAAPFPSALLVFRRQFPGPYRWTTR